MSTKQKLGIYNGPPGTAAPLVSNWGRSQREFALDKKPEKEWSLGIDRLDFSKIETAEHYDDAPVGNWGLNGQVREHEQHLMLERLEMPSQDKQRESLLRRGRPLAAQSTRRHSQSKMCAPSRRLLSATPRAADPPAGPPLPTSGCKTPRLSSFSPGQTPAQP